MNKYTFKSGAETFHRISKSAAKKAFQNGELLIMAPCNLIPNGYWKCGLRVQMGNALDKASFDEYVRNFEWYNCNSNETGLYTSFYSIQKLNVAA